MTHELVVTGGRVALPGGLADVDIAVDAGVIAALGEPGSLSGERVEDASGLLVLPGAIDIHVHLREPGLEHKEDFAHGTRAAACGGVTAVFDMPNTKPPVTSPERLKEKLSIVRGSAWVDFGLWAGGTDISAFEEMKAAGAIGLKVYMNRSKRPDDPYSNDLSMPDADTFRDVLAEAARIGWPVSVHTCDPDQEDAERERLQAQSSEDARLICRLYRAPGSVDAVRLVVDLARETGAQVHIAHVSLAATEAVTVVSEAQRAGVRVTCEAAPPALEEDELLRLGTFGTPFAFPPEDCDFYWRAMAAGSIDCVATDHAPHARADKLSGSPDVWKAPPGYPGVETSLPLMLDAALTGRMSLQRVVDLTSTRPASILGLRGKGRIDVGADADLVLVDPHAETEIDEARLHSKAGWSPFHGRRLGGRLVATLLRGEAIARDGDIVGDRPLGRVCAPVSRDAAAAPQPSSTARSDS